MSGPHFVGDPAGCGSAVDPNIVFVPVPCTYTCCYSILPQNETIVHQPKTKTPYDELVDSFVQSNLKALEKTSLKHPKEDKATAVRQPLLDTSAKQLKQEIYPISKQLNKPLNKKNIENPDCNRTNNEDTKSVKSPSWASNYLQKIGQPHQQTIKINLKPKKPTQREENPTSSSSMKMADNKQIDNSQKNNNTTDTIDIFAPLRPKLKYVIPKLNQPKKNLNDVLVKSLPCKNKSIKEITKEKNTVATAPPGTITKLPKSLRNNCPKQRVESLGPVLKEKTIKTRPTSPSKDTYFKNKVIVNKSKTNRVISSSISKINKKYTTNDNGKKYTTNDNGKKQLVNVKEVHKTKEKNSLKTSKSDIKLKKNSSPTRNVSKAKSNHAIKSTTPPIEINNKQDLYGENAAEKILKDKKLPKVKYISTKNTSAMHDKHGSANKNDIVSKKEVLKTIRLKQVALCENLSHALIEGEDDIFDLRQKLNKKEICRKLQELENTQNEIKQYFQKNVHDSLDQILNKNEKHIAPASSDTLNTNIKPKEPRVREIKLVIKIIHEEQTTRSADVPSIKNEKNDDLDFLDDFNVDEVVNYLNQCEDKSNSFSNENSYTNCRATDINDNIEEKLELLFKESPQDSLIHKKICDEKLQISKEVTFEPNAAVSKEIGSEVFINEPIVLDPNETLLTDVKIEAELDLMDGTCTSGEAKFIENENSYCNVTKNLPIVEENPNIKIIIEQSTNPNSDNTKIVNLVNDIILPTVNNADNNGLDQKKSSDKQYGDGNNITKSDQKDENHITLKDVKTDSESTTISLSHIENGSDREIEFIQSDKEGSITINEEINAITKVMKEPKVVIDSTRIKNVYVQTPINVNDQCSDENNVIKPEDGNKTLKRKNSFQQEVNDNLNRMESNVSCGSTLSYREKLCAQSLQNRISDYFEKTLKITILSVIRKGEFSIIFKCKNSDDVNYAAKISANHHQMLINRFIRQEAMIKAFQKDIPTENLNCVYLVNGFELQRRWVLLLEYYPYNLQQFLCEKKSKSVNVSHLQNLARQLVGAVITLRNRDIVHSDIKPSHILLNAAGSQLKLCGFDSAYYFSPQALLPKIGTVNYRAPEIIIGHSAGFSIDVWSTAVVLYEMVTGYQLFPGYYNNDILFKQMSTLGNIPFNMLMNSIFTGEHFRGSIFLRRVGPMGQKTVLIHRFQKSERLNTTIYKEYRKQWGPSVPKAQQDKELSKLRSLVKLLEQMLTIDPKHRMAIEFVYASPFIHETF